MKYIKQFGNFVLNESIDRYSFGKYVYDINDDDYLSNIFKKLELEDITIGDYIKIRSVIPSFGASRIQNIFPECMCVEFKLDDIDGMYHEIYYLGDYCYSLIVRDYDWQFEYIEIFDDIDSLLDSLEKIKEKHEES